MLSIGTRNGLLVFPTKELFEDYKKDEAELFRKYQDILRKDYGVWAKNQNKFVPDESYFNDDDRPKHKGTPPWGNPWGCDE